MLPVVLLVRPKSVLFSKYFDCFDCFSKCNFATTGYK